MHIADGVLSWQVLGAGTAVGAAGVTLGLRALRERDIPVAGLLGAAFFVASLIHVPIGGTSVHLVLTGLMGMILGWTVFPVLLVALLLQSVLLGHGGVTVLGVNAAVLGIPAVICYHAFGLRRVGTGRRGVMLRGFTAGTLAVILASLLTGGALLASGGEFSPIFKGLVVLHLPVAAAEGIITAGAAGFLWKVRPEILT